MKTTVRDFVDGKADLAFGHYGVPRPVYANEAWSDPKEIEANEKVAALRKKVREKKER